VKKDALHSRKRLPDTPAKWSLLTPVNNNIHLYNDIRARSGYVCVCVCVYIAKYLPASARCMMKKFIRFLRALLNDKAISTAPLPSTIDRNNIHRTVNCMVCGKKTSSLFVYICMVNVKKKYIYIRDKSRRRRAYYTYIIKRLLSFSPFLRTRKFETLLCLYFVGSRVSRNLPNRVNWISIVSLAVYVLNV